MRALAPSTLAVALTLAPALFAQGRPPPPLPAPPMPPTPGDEAPESPLGRMSRIVGEGVPPPPGAGLVLRDGRELRRSARSLRERYPYLVAANAAERATGHGIELRWENLHRLFEPIASEAAAVSLVRRMEGGEVVPDRAAYDRLVDAARRNPMPADSWPVTVHPRVPERFGLAAERAGGGFEVRGTIFTTSGYSALDVVEVHARFPAEGPWSIETIPAISGPPQSWQTSGPVDEAEQRALHDAVFRLRAALLDALRRDWTLDGVTDDYEHGTTPAMLRARLGEPLREIGKWQRQLIYRVGDGRVVVFDTTNEDAPIASATLHASYDPEKGLGEKVEAIRPKSLRLGGP